MKTAIHITSGESPGRLAQERRAQTLEMLHAAPGLRVAVVMDDEAEHSVTLTLAIRFRHPNEIAVCEYTIARDKFSAPLFMQSLEYGALH